MAKTKPGDRALPTTEPIQQRIDEFLKLLAKWTVEEQYLPGGISKEDDKT